MHRRVPASIQYVDIVPCLRIGAFSGTVAEATVINRLLTGISYIGAGGGVDTDGAGGQTQDALFQIRKTLIHSNPPPYQISRHHALPRLQNAGISQRSTQNLLWNNMSSNSTPKAVRLYYLNVSFEMVQTLRHKGKANSGSCNRKKMIVHYSFPYPRLQKNSTPILS
jgi:hypothetical protein